MTLGGSSGRSLPGRTRKITVCVSGSAKVTPPAQRHHTIEPSSIGVRTKTGIWRVVFCW